MENKKQKSTNKNKNKNDFNFNEEIKKRIKLYKQMSSKYKNLLDKYVNLLSQLDKKSPLYYKDFYLYNFRCDTYSRKLKFYNRQLDYLIEKYGK